MRVYLPATLDTLSTLVRGGEWAAGGAAHAVTDDVRRSDPGGDLDSWEFDAFCDAADTSLRLLQAEPSAPDRRVVVSADVDDVAVQPAQGTDVASAVVVDAAVVLDAVAAVHLDGSDAEPLVRRVREGEPVELLRDVALQWYDPSELDDVLA